MDPESDHENRGGEKQDVADHWRHWHMEDPDLEIDEETGEVAAVDHKSDQGTE